MVEGMMGGFIVCGTFGLRRGLVSGKGCGRRGWVVSVFGDEDPLSGMTEEDRAKVKEWGLAPGDQELQDELAREMTWGALRVSSTEFLDFFVRREMLKQKENMDRWYVDQARKLRESGERVAIQESLENVARWNQWVSTSSRESHLRRTQNNEELAIVEALLRRHRRVKGDKPLYRVAVRRRATASGASLDGGVPVRSGMNPSIFPLAFLVTCCGMRAFDSVAKRFGPEFLAGSAVLYSIFLLTISASLIAVEGKRPNQTLK
eukprot:CAMPEP_0184686128 /NCGR_PEP_ID=MMETSP0312-20130426/21369_1 /TAXON_ID=31354 /ORGANISM="Compsopogon coeruleus, Strain SAG 36.94" /LENGTH=261 /DNA_ID=CAMNT_0027140899 /DNA_START=580 /DNA_END=1365 /DNA_ORIENTATION=-